MKARCAYIAGTGVGNVFSACPPLQALRGMRVPPAGDRGRNG